MDIKKHTPVLLDETIDGLEIEPADTVFDGTFGEGGHSNKIMEKLTTGTLIGVDLDTKTIEQAKKIYSKERRFFVEDNFRNIESILDSLNIEKVNKALLDLGFGSHQLDSGKGFSFRADEKLNMHYSSNKDILFTAENVVNDWDENNLFEIIKGFGEERWAKRIAKKIIEYRETKRIETSKELGEIIDSAIPKRFQSRRIHPATKTFQAIRMAVNDEIGALRDFLSVVENKLESKGRIAIISFHSIEDRIVKKTFRLWEQEGKGKNLTKRPIKPTEEEILKNKRSRSAKLRVFVKN